MQCWQWSGWAKHAVDTDKHFIMSVAIIRKIEKKQQLNSNVIGSGCKTDQHTLSTIMSADCSCHHCCIRQQVQHNKCRNIHNSCSLNVCHGSLTVHLTASRLHMQWLFHWHLSCKSLRITQTHTQVHRWLWFIICQQLLFLTHSFCGIVSTMENNAKHPKYFWESTLPGTVILSGKLHRKIYDNFIIFFHSKLG